MISRIIKVGVGVLRFSHFFLFHVISKQLCHLRRPFYVCESLSSTIFSMSCSVNEANLEVVFLLLHWRPKSNKKRENLTWLPLEIMHRGHAWHDYPWPWVSLHEYIVWSADRWRPRRWFWKFTVRFRPIRKEIVSWMYNNTSNTLLKVKCSLPLNFEDFIM